jgi:hypothetical protein
LLDVARSHPLQIVDEEKRRDKSRDKTDEREKMRSGKEQERERWIRQDGN